MNEQSEEKKTGIKVIDRRRFDSDGDEKPETEDSKTAQIKLKDTNQVTNNAKPQESVQSIEEEIMTNNTNKTSQSEQEVSAGEDYEGDISFGSFVISMATQALMLLGQIKAPDGLPVSVDPQAAKQSIDILSMLEAKTRGNLTAQEEGLMKDALHNLKVAFLRFK